MFNNKKIIITGGSSGLGLKLTEILSDKGAKIGLIARDENKLKNTIKQFKINKAGASLIYRAVDVTNTEASQSAIDELAHELGGIDILINSAGILREGYFESIDLSVFKEIMETNVFGIITTTKAALPYLKKSQGRLVNVASVAALTGVFGYTAYCMTKHALAGLSESLYYELTPQGVKVQLVCPPEFDSPMVDKLDEGRTPENREHTLMIPKVSVDVIANATIKGLQSDKYLIVTGTMAKISAWTMRHFPSLMRFYALSKIKGKYIGPS